MKNMTSGLGKSTLGPKTRVGGAAWDPGPRERVAVLADPGGDKTVLVPRWEGAAPLT